MACETKPANTGTDEAPRKATRFAAPPVDIYETEDGVTVLADLPGVNIEDVDIRVEDDRLTIEGKSSSANDTANDTANSLHQEFRLFDFYRQFELGSEVDREKISAGVKDGVLTISLPKAEKIKPKRIEVKVA